MRDNTTREVYVHILAYFLSSNRISTYQSLLNHQNLLQACVHIQDFVIRWVTLILSISSLILQLYRQSING